MWRPRVAAGAPSTAQGNPARRRLVCKKQNHLAVMTIVSGPRRHGSAIWNVVPYNVRPSAVGPYRYLPHISCFLCACGNGYRTQCGSAVGAGQGGISTRWQGYENSLHVRCKGTLHYVSGGCRVFRRGYWAALRPTSKRCPIATGTGCPRERLGQDGLALAASTQAQPSGVSILRTLAV